MAKFQALPHSTRNDLPAATRARVGVLLNARLADTIDLQLQAKQAHWNVKGPNFIALHELFDKVADAAEEASDMLAERLVALGGRAEGTGAGGGQAHHAALLQPDAGEWPRSRAGGGRRDRRRRSRHARGDRRR